MLGGPYDVRVRQWIDDWKRQKYTVFVLGRPAAAKSSTEVVCEMDISTADRQEQSERRRADWRQATLLYVNAVIDASHERLSLCVYV